MIASDRSPCAIPSLPQRHSLLFRSHCAATKVGFLPIPLPLVPIPPISYRPLGPLLTPSYRHGGLPPTSIRNLSLVFSGTNDRPDPIEAWWQRRNALIVILRARFSAGVRGEPELKGTWDEWALPDKDGPTLDELTMEEAEAEGEGDVEGVLRVGDDGKVVVNETLGLKTRELSLGFFFTFHF